MKKPLKESDEVSVKQTEENLSINMAKMGGAIEMYYKRCYNQYFKRLDRTRLGVEYDLRPKIDVLDLSN